MKNFTLEELNLLSLDGWDILRSNLADKDYKRIKKIDSNKFLVETLITGSPDDNDYWEWDSEHETLKKAINR